MATWEDEDFEPSLGKGIGGTDKWEGEDEDDDSIKDNWEDEDEEAEKQSAETQVVEKKKKKPLAERIKEKEEAKLQKKKEMEEAMKAMEEKDDDDLTPEERLAEKLRKQKLQEEADLLIAQETFGISEAELPGKKTIDNFEPSSKDDFAEFGRLLAEKVTKYESSPEYTAFLEALCRDCCAGMDANDIKRISTTLNVLATEKTKVAKGGKAKKKTTKKALVGASTKTRKDDFMDYDNQFDDFDDFM
eukprot:Seg2312.3 transcript_id=Seg2312.3/GoldUCD/mRNA.D3Y31 product="Eukaryotic translation initiation factor 3 subunit J" protein_id=Seg2312.3/GoldUCD/D3Y31